MPRRAIVRRRRSRVGQVRRRAALARRHRHRRHRRINRSIWRAHAVGQSLFVLAGTGNRATLWLRQEERVVTAAPADIMDAIVGVSHRARSSARGADRMRRAIVRRHRVPRFTDACSRLTPPTHGLYLEQMNGQWRTRAATTDAFVVEFAAYDGALPSDVWIWSVAGREPAASVRFSISRSGNRWADSGRRVPGAARRRRRQAAHARGTAGRRAVERARRVVRKIIMPRALTLRPSAKINLTLRVGHKAAERVPRRSDDPSGDRPVRHADVYAEARPVCR